MIETLFVHIGAPKTGSTSLQKYLFSIRDKLLEREVLFPPMAANHYFLASAFHQKPASLFANKLRSRTTPRRLEKFHSKNLEAFSNYAHSKDWKSGIITSESLTMLNDSGVSRLKNFLTAIAKEVKIVCYVRHPLADAVSRAQQNIKVGILLWDDFFDEMRFPAVIRTFKAQSRLKSYSKHFGKNNIILRPFDRRILHDGDIVTDFLSVIQHPDLGEAGFAANSSLTQEATIVASEINKAFPPIVNGKRNINRPATNFLWEISGRKFSLPSSALKFAESEGEKITSFICQSFGLEIPKPSVQPYEELASDATIAALTRETFKNENDWDKRNFIETINALAIHSPESAR